MPPFPEKESSLLAKLKKSKPHVEELVNQAAEKKQRPVAVVNHVRYFLCFRCICIGSLSLINNLYA